MTGLASKTLAIFEDVSTLSCIKDFVLVGGTSIAVQINHRLSEDLDFCRWVPVSNVANGIAVKTIEEELKAKFAGDVKTNQLSFDQVDFLVKGVKVTFFNEVGFKVPPFTPVDLKGNIKCVPLHVVAAMKVKTMFERNTFRDYYDTFVLLKEGHISTADLVKLSIDYHSRLGEKLILNRLRQWEKVTDEKGFSHLSPKYDFTLKAMGEFLIEHTSK